MCWGIGADGVKPWGMWFEEASKLCTLRTFTRSDVPAVVNNVNVTHIAHVSDFYRMDVRVCYRLPDECSLE